MNEARKATGVTITVFSTASAVGKTLLAVNMASELAREGFKTCIVDLDVQFGDVCNYLHIVPRTTLFAAQEAMKKEMDSFRILDYLERYEYEGTSFSILPAPILLEESYNIMTDAVLKMLQQLQQEFDYIVLDTTAAFSELNLAVMNVSTIITFVGIVDFIPTVKNMKIGYDTMQSIGYGHKIRFVLNRSNSKTRIELSDVEQLLGGKFYHILSNDFGSALDSVQSGVPLILADKSTELAHEMRELVAKYTNRSVEEEDTAQEQGASWFKKIFR